MDKGIVPVRKSWIELLREKPNQIIPAVEDDVLLGQVKKDGSFLRKLFDNSVLSKLAKVGKFIGGVVVNELAFPTTTAPPYLTQPVPYLTLDYFTQKTKLPEKYADFKKFLADNKIEVKTKTDLDKALKMFMDSLKPKEAQAKETFEQGKRKATKQGKRKATKTGAPTLQAKETGKLEEPKLELKFWGEQNSFDLLKQVENKLQASEEALRMGQLEQAYNNVLSSMADMKQNYTLLRQAVISGITQVLTRPLELPPNAEPSDIEKTVRGITDALLGLALAFAPPSRVDFYVGIINGYRDALLEQDERRKQEALQQYQLALERDLRTREFQLKALALQLQEISRAEELDTEMKKLELEKILTLMDQEIKRMELAQKQALELQKIFLKHWFDMEKLEAEYEKRKELEKLKGDIKRSIEMAKEREKTRRAQMKASRKADQEKQIWEALFGKGKQR